MNKQYICYFIAGVSLIIVISMAFLMILSLSDARTQEAENKVIIEQLCNLDKTSYWCKKL